MSKIVANWKMYLTIRESRERAALVRDWFARTACDKVDFVICPSALALHDVLQQLGESPVRLGVQEIALSRDAGAYTGQTSTEQASESQVEFCLAGHSEMRGYYHVTDEMVAKQVDVALAGGLTPVVCIGETGDERAQGKTDHVILRQLETIFTGISTDKEVWIAYEPRWAIGTGKPVDPKEAARVHTLIAQALKEFSLGPTSILYGGSVSAETLMDFLNQPHVDGVLIGSASAKQDALDALLKKIEQELCV